MTQFNTLETMTKNKQLPIMGTNEDNEVVIIESGASIGEKFFRVTTVQKNDWLRINTYWENGTTEETYKK